MSSNCNDQAMAPLLVGWNDSKGFTAGFTLSSYAYSTNGGASFTDGGNVPLSSASDQAFGDTGIDTDEKGNWYLNEIYTRTGPSQQNIGVHHGRFNGSGALVWDAPVQAATVNGRIAVNTSTGPVQATTINGSIEANMQTLTSGDVRLTTVNGSVSAGLPTNINANIDAETVNGRVETDFPVR